jgi:hypothetical protein
MASTKRSALATNAIVDTTALHQYNTTNFVQYASFEQHKRQAPSFKPQATSVKHQAIQAASSKHQAPSNKHQATSREQVILGVFFKLLDFIALIKIREARSEGLNYPLVVKYIGEIRDEYQKKYDVTYGRHVTELARIRDEARVKGAWSAATNAEIARGKAAGLYIEQKIIHHNKIQDLTADELKAKMKKILDDNKGLIEADFAEVIEPTKEIEN